eukprot:1142120-Pelagomonas_calceolata.AAC.3
MPAPKSVTRQERHDFVKEICFPASHLLLSVPTTAPVTGPVWMPTRMCMKPMSGLLRHTGSSLAAAQQPNAKSAIRAACVSGWGCRRLPAHMYASPMVSTVCASSIHRPTVSGTCSRIPKGCCHTCKLTGALLSEAHWKAPQTEMTRDAGKGYRFGSQQVASMLGGYLYCW